MAKIRNPLEVTIDWKGLNRREHFIDNLIKENNWTIGCEVGVRTGRTLFHLLNNNPHLKMYAVDKDITQFYNKEIQNKYKNRLVVLEGMSWECSSKIKEQLDFVFIDASHSTKNVIKDINSYQPLLSDNKGMLGHDIDFPAIQKALEKLNISYNVGPDNVWIAK